LEVIADALQGQIYCQRFEWQEDRWKPVGPVRIRAFADWALDAAPDSICAGPGAAKFADRLPAAIRLAGEACNEPDCASLLQVAHADAARGQASAWDIEPIYLRGSSAEEKRKQS
jgi:tRNA threonylcarbamoyladenosine biosynthesis protein TsaB